MTSIVQSPDPVLNTVCDPCEPGDKSLKKLAKQMAKAMYGNDGCGLAAPQLGVTKRLVVVDCDVDSDEREPIVLVNPVLVETQGDPVVEGEGCLSCPGISVPIARPPWARVRYFDLDGEEWEIEGDGLLGRCLQHELRPSGRHHHVRARRPAGAHPSPARLRAGPRRRREAGRDLRRAAGALAMRVVFMGTPAFAASILEDLAQQHEVVAVYTRPDAVRGRGRKLVPSPVKLAAEGLGIPVLTPKTLRDEAALRKLASFAPDVVCVAAYGAILPPAALAVPRYGCLNVHASLLPRWRGAAPVERAILAGDEETGVCVMRMEEGLDTGAYCVCRTTRIEGKGAEELSDELAVLGSHALLTALVHVENGAAEWTEQDEGQVTYASKLEKGELDLDPADPAAVLARKVQASSAAHPARCVLAGRGVTVLSGQEAESDGPAAGLTEGLAPGQARFSGKRLLLGCAEGAYEVRDLKPDGKQAMDARAFAAGAAALREGDAIWEKRHA